MEANDIKRLKYLYQSNELSQEDSKLLEQAIEHGDIDPLEFVELNYLHQQIQSIPSQNTPLAIKDQLTDLIEKEKQLIQHSKRENNKEYIIRWAMTAAAMFLGVIFGLVVPFGKSTNTSSTTELATLKQEMQSLKETMALTLLQDDAPSERLKAVNYTTELDLQSQKIIEALLQTLNSDDNINVRLAAIEALHKYGQDAWVREQLVKSIAAQSSPLVQMALAECMVSFKEKSSIVEFEKLIKKQETPQVIKEKLASYVKQM